MPSRLNVQIAEYELHDLFAVYRIWELLESGFLSEVIREQISPAKRRCSLGGESLFTRVVLTADPDTEVARIHYLRCGFGHMIAAWPSHIVIDGTLLYRRGHQRRPVE